jgi:hypothetical protein
VYVNGQQINISSNASSWLNQSTFQTLLQALNSSPTGGSDQSGQGTVQVQIWNA